jgi:ketosteroid isomerase-like protein
MHRSAVILAICLFLTTQAAASPQDRTGAIVGAMQQRRSAETRGDIAQWEAVVSPECVWIEPNGHKTGILAHKPVGDKNNSVIAGDISLSETEVHDFGSIAILTYREEVTSKVGANELHSVVRFTEVYRNSPDHWVLVYSTETPVVERKGVDIDPAKFRDYVGEYELAPGLIGIVSLEGGKLTLFSKGWKKPYELVPLSESRFFVRQFETTEITFVRDANGKVTQHTSDSPGQPTLIAKKMQGQTRTGSSLFQDRCQLLHH